MSCKTISLHIDLVYKPLIDERSHRNLYKQCRRFKIASQVIKIEIPTDYVLEFPDSSDQVLHHSKISKFIHFFSKTPQLSPPSPPVVTPDLTYAVSPPAPPPVSSSSSPLISPDLDNVNTDASGNIDNTSSSSSNVN